MKTIKLYHGTRANPDSIMALGLLAGGLDRVESDPIEQVYRVNKERTLQRVLKEFNLTKAQVPEWTYRGELEYEEGYPIHIHFEINPENAKGYADMGGEPAYCIRRNLMIWLAGISNVSQIEVKDQLKEINKKAKEVNGPQPYLVEVELNWDDPRIDKDAKKSIERILEFKGSLDNWGHTLEVRYYGDVPPENIKSITPCEFKNPWG